MPIEEKCKRVIDYVDSHYDVKLEYEDLVCGFSDANKQCIKERCTFYPGQQ